jgi:enediyne biosynthesis protein E4
MRTVSGTRRRANAATAGLVLVVCGLPDAARAASSVGEKPVFVDITREAGIVWGPWRLEDGNWNLVDTMGGGCAFLDYDQDGRLDILLVSYTLAAQPESAGPPRDALYRSNGDGTFTDVTEKAGLVRRMRGMGVAVGDYDNDGWPDLYITGWRQSRLYHNQRDGAFRDVTLAAGVMDPLWGTSVAFLDYDKDGQLDVFVGNYLDFDPDGPGVPCRDFENRPFCTIAFFKGSASLLFRNRGDGTFADVSAAAGIADPGGKAMGVVTGDFDDDGWPDIFLSNDATPNFLFQNHGDGTFTDVALEAEVALNANGQAKGGMGCDAGDAFGSGKLDIVVASFSGQSLSLFRNQGRMSFLEVGYGTGLAAVSRGMSHYAPRFLDYDNDGRMDLFVLCGHPFEPVSKVWPGINYMEPPFLFENTGDGFKEVAAERGEALKRPYPGRGLASGDFDDDGDTDLLLMPVGPSPVLLRNDGGNARSWLGVRLLGTRSNHDGYGARIYVSACGQRHWREVLGGTSYQSASDLRQLFGLGACEAVEQIEVRWPSGTVDVLRGVTPRQYLTIREGDHAANTPK